jgi:hypothetical protein
MVGSKLEITLKMLFVGTAAGVAAFGIGTGVEYLTEQPLYESLISSNSFLQAGHDFLEHKTPNLKGWYTVYVASVGFTSPLARRIVEHYNELSTFYATHHRIQS